MFNPKFVTIGKDVKYIKYNEHCVNKFFKNKDGYDNTINFYKLYNYKFIPKLISSNIKNISIKQQYVGNMLSLKRNIPYNWEKQLNIIRNEFIKKKIIIQDLRFLPYTPIVVNNFTVHNNQIYIVDLTMVLECSTDYINYKFDNLIFQINLYLFILKYINYRFLIIPHLFYHILVLIFDW
tara:strand:- start:14 stop:553 length:540 start_codon:yes stop_codon:yes gene_type:complete